MPDEIPAKRRRKTIRLEEYDYSSPGAYFVTICTYRYTCFFGNVESGKMLLNVSGKMIERWWRRIPDKYPNLQIETHIVMPNHLHGIINILEPKENSERVGADPCVRPVVALPESIKWFKTMTTNEYIRGVKQGKWEGFDMHLWQRSYYEHVIRKLEDINEVREYILDNPLRWEIKKKNK